MQLHRVSRRRAHEDQKAYLIAPGSSPGAWTACLTLDFGAFAFKSQEKSIQGTLKKCCESRHLGTNAAIGMRYKFFKVPFRWLDQIKPVQ